MKSWRSRVRLASHLRERRSLRKRDLDPPVAAAMRYGRRYCRALCGRHHGDELRAATERGEPDDGSRYYHHLLVALDRLITDKGLTSPEAMQERKELGPKRHTPRSKPVGLAAGLTDHEHS